jgi:hypothetical protein
MEIMFNDLTCEAQKRLLKEAGITSPKERNWDTIPVAVVEFKEEGSEPEEDFLEDVFSDDTYDFGDDGPPY